MSISARNRSPFLIAGGGIGGLACAVALAQKGFRVCVLEQAPEFGHVGAGLQVAPNALSVLDALGIGASLKRQALLIERMLFADGITGETICDIPCDREFERRFGNPYAVVHRADVHAVLLEACRSNALLELRTNSRVTRYEVDGTLATVFLESGEVLTASGFVAADGVRSRVREKIVGDGEPKPAGAVIFRALIPAEKMPDRLKKAYPTMWGGPGAHMIYYPVRGWQEYNLGATVNVSGPPPEEGVVEGDVAREAFADWTDTVSEILRLSDRFQRYVIRHRDPVSNWSQGPVTLLGDAAHPMVQYIAQGAAMALEDAVCLADQVDKADGDATNAFDRYQKIRIVRTARMQLSSIMLDRLYHVGGLERLVRNSIFDGRSRDQHFERLDWIFGAPDYVRDWEPVHSTG
jgi:3-hydroxybenzoate 6-monooxygenase